MDQLEITVYARARSLPCWRAKRLLRRKVYAFRAISAAAGDEPRAPRAEAAGRAGCRRSSWMGAWWGASGP